MPHEELSIVNLIYLLLSNITVLLFGIGIFFLFVLMSGYQGITIKLKKDKENKKISKQKYSQEQLYLNRLEKNIKKKKQYEHRN